MSNGFFEEVESYAASEGYIIVEVPARQKDTYGSDGDILVTTSNGGGGANTVWINRKDSKRLRKALKRAEKFLES